jgi:hypothetical protein
MTLLDELLERARARFFDVPQVMSATSEGPVALPILYYEASNVVALFRASRAGAERLLEGTGLEPELDSKGRAIAALSFYEYRRTSVGTYNEVGTAILARPRGARASRLGLAEMLAPTRGRTAGAYVVDLPVTTAAACAAGLEIWGYPKFVTEIAFRLAERELECTVFDPESAGRAPIVTIRGRAGPWLSAPPIGVVTFSVLGEALIRTCIDVRGRVAVHLPGSVALEVGPSSSHRMAENLRTLGLASSRPFLVIETDRFQSRLPEGTSATAAATAPGSARARRLRTEAGVEVV